MDTIKHTLTLYPSKSSEVTTKSQTFQKTIRLLVEHNSIWHFAIYQSKDSSPLNVINIFWSIFNTHFREPSSIHLRSTHQNPQRSQLNHRHFRKLSDFSWNTIQLTLCDLPIKRLLASKCNKYILKYLQHTFPSTIKHTLTLYPSKSSEITNKSQTFQKTIRLLAEHNSIWHFAIC